MSDLEGVGDFFIGETGDTYAHTFFIPVVLRHKLTCASDVIVVVSTTSTSGEIWMVKLHCVVELFRGSP